MKTGWYGISGTARVQCFFCSGEARWGHSNKCYCVKHFNLLNDAAPDLLEALEEAATHLYYQGGKPFRASETGVCLRVQQAILKAKGESHE
jgi:hypothetical protein